MGLCPGMSPVKRNCHSHFGFIGRQNQPAFDNVLRVPQAGQSTELANNQIARLKRVRQKPHVTSHDAPRMTHRSERQPLVARIGLMPSTVSRPIAWSPSDKASRRMSLRGCTLQ
jgi:hypothetical protein